MTDVREGLARAEEPGGAIARIPDDRVMQMLAACARQVEQAATIEDAKEAATAAEAIAAIARKVAVAKDIKKAAVRLLVSSEAKLGVLMGAMPKHTKPGKVATLASIGIDRRRTNIAERLAKVPQEKVDAVIAAGANTMHGVTSKLGLLSNGYDLRTQRASAYKLLAEEAVGLLDRSVKRGAVPHAGTVAEMVRRLASIGAHANTRD